MECALSQAQPKRVWLGYSGGVDSQLMATLLARWQSHHPDIPCHLLHVHHGLSANADSWAEHCQRSAEQLGLAIEIIPVQLNPGPRESVEALARTARYQAFKQRICAQDILLTGHHLDDQAETLLLALKRGSGPKGLSAMPAQQPLGAGRLLRPWLAFERAELEAAARELGLAHIEDDSNQDLRFDRNFLRHQVLPQWQQRWPGVKRSLARSAELCAEQQQLCDELAQQDWQACVLPGQGLSLTNSEGFSLARRNNLLRYWLALQDALLPSRVQLAQLQDFWTARPDSQPQLDWGEWSVRRYQQGLYLLAKAPPVLPTQEVFGPDPLANGEHWKLVSRDSGPRLSLPQGLSGLTVCYGLPGSLRLHPVGRNGSRPLKKLWQEYGVPPWQRDRVAMLCYHDRPIAALGYWQESWAQSTHGQGWCPEPG
ncbi:tRNA(Ile)-lysidine synthase [Ferrimonas marina]|uniref:tRNA(Ile)-lysidine synthase n=1 Tax=Ferrimonas marina TaxID=299255 RepID=A0A1M5YFE5_9GAMM|nr:tRNA(Ile)-lysidine synthase [Ferrimonas marina]